MKAGKKVSFGTKPTAAHPPATADEWVENRQASDREPTKRFTIDVPVSLHRRVKSQCALQTLVMADVVRELLERRFPEGAGGEPVNTTARKHDASYPRRIGS